MIADFCDLIMVPSSVTPKTGYRLMAQSVAQKKPDFTDLNEALTWGRQR